MTREEYRELRRRIDMIEGDMVKSYQTISQGRVELVLDLLRRGYTPAEITRQDRLGLEHFYYQHLVSTWRKGWELGLATGERLIQEKLARRMGEDRVMDFQFYFPDEDVWGIFVGYAGHFVRIESETTKEKIGDILVEGIKKGLGIYDMAKELRDKVGIAEGRAKNIASTETMRAFSLGNWVKFKRVKVEYVRITAVLDFATCEECAAKDGVVLPLEKAERGYWPPFHFQCRCIAEPYWKEDIEEEGLEVSDVKSLPPPDPKMKEYGFGYPGTYPRIYEALRSRVVPPPSVPHIPVPGRPTIRRRTEYAGV